MKKKDMTFEQAMKRLEEITDKMQNSDMQVEKSIQLFSEGMELVALCREKLDNVSLKISQLTEEKQVPENE